jgi:hypothetical protein
MGRPPKPSSRSRAPAAFVQRFRHQVGGILAGTPNGPAAGPDKKVITPMRKGLRQRRAGRHSVETETTASALPRKK